MPYELVTVMPVYNEAECIGDVVRSWRNALGSLDIRFRMLVLNDGSTDDTAGALEAFSGDDRIEVIDKSNSGHGPTILEGYRRAVELGDWVFQCDSDDEMPPEGFAELWNRREQFDALFGYRQSRVQSLGRKIISGVSRLTVRLMGGSGVRDVNTPYRLIRAPLLRAIVAQIPPDTFAPNVIVSGAVARAKVRIFNHPVPHRGRRTGTVSIVKWKLWRAAVRSFWQTIRCRPRVDAGDLSGNGK